MSWSNMSAEPIPPSVDPDLTMQGCPSGVQGLGGALFVPSVPCTENGLSSGKDAFYIFVFC